MHSATSPTYISNIEKWPNAMVKIRVSGQMHIQRRRYLYLKCGLRLPSFLECL